MGSSPIASTEQFLVRELQDLKSFPRSPSLVSVLSERACNNIAIVVATCLLGASLLVFPIAQSAAAQLSTGNHGRVVANYTGT